MKNTTTCPICKTENPFYLSKCENCNTFLKDKVSNIDLWPAFGKLIENPVQAFTQIIRSEHKNFIFPILLFASIKFFIDSIFLLMLRENKESVSGGFILNTFIIFAGVLVLVALFSLLLKYTTPMLQAKTRFKDNFGILSYSLILHAIALCILFPVELVLFGSYIFSSNPSPFQIKETLAYIMAGFEVLIVLWSFSMVVIGIFTQTKNVLYSLGIGVIFNLAIFYLLYLSGIFL